MNVLAVDAIVDLNEQEVNLAIDKAKLQGTVNLGAWDASTNTPTITEGVGTQGNYYDVAVAGTFGGENYIVGDYIKCDANKHWYRVPTGIETDNPTVVAYIDENTVTFPTTRPSGNPLKIGDYVKVKSTATLPFDIGGIHIDNYGDTIEWNGTAWQLKDYYAGKTDEIAVKDKSKESFKGSDSTAKMQSDINAENVAELKLRPYNVDTMPTASVKNEGHTVLYLGATTTAEPIYKNSRYYKCVEITPSTDPKTYKWVLTDMWKEFDKMTLNQKDESKNKQANVSYDSNGNLVFTPIIDPPQVSISVSPDKITKGTSTAISITVVATKGGKNIESIAITGSNGFSHTITSGVSEGGTFTVSNNTSDNTTYTVLVTADTQTATASASVMAEETYKGYFGTAGGGLTEFDCSGRAFGSSVSLNNDAIVYKYPKKFGELNRIVMNGDEVLSYFSKSEETISTVPYYAYVSQAFNGTYDVSFS